MDPVWRRLYAAANITTNLYVVTQPWLYSLAWCAGVHSVTTNAPHLLSALQTPLFLMVGNALCVCVCVRMRVCSCACVCVSVSVYLVVTLRG